MTHRFACDHTLTILLTGKTPDGSVRQHSIKKCTTIDVKLFKDNFFITFAMKQTNYCRQNFSFLIDMFRVSRLRSVFFHNLFFYFVLVLVGHISRLVFSNAICLSPILYFLLRWHFAANTF